MTELKDETSKGTDRPWSRPGNLAQNPKAQLPTRDQREREYESKIGGAERSGYLQGQGASQPSALSGSNPATSDINENGKVGEPLPLLLAAIVVAPVIAVIIAVLWFYMR
jgi:hypothetical protein